LIFVPDSSFVDCVR